MDDLILVLRDVLEINETLTKKAIKENDFLRLLELQLHKKLTQSALIDLYETEMHSYERKLNAKTKNR